ncbi:hypothetical protein LJC07_07445 [Christensenellaceae bacterium OttesenSCG-928-L17]|nr:hypothetical protein [Christensenellaceae bacterium OttesenSCG-928-L17]
MLQTIEQLQQENAELMEQLELEKETRPYLGFSLNNMLLALDDRTDSLTIFPALIMGIERGGEGRYTIMVDRLEYNEAFLPASGSDTGPYLLNAEETIEALSADSTFTIWNLGSKSEHITDLTPELIDEIQETQFVVYAIEDVVFMLDEIYVP